MKYTIFNPEDNPAYWQWGVVPRQAIEFLARTKAERASKSRGQLCEYGDAPRVVRMIVAALASGEAAKLVPWMQEIANSADENLNEIGSKRSLRQISEVLELLSGIPSATIRDWCQRADRGDRRKGGQNYRG